MWLAAWLAATTQEPAATPVTVLPLTVQVDFVVELKVTAKPELAVQTQLPDGSRLAAWIPPLVMPSPTLAIRKFNGRH